jgi:hypothetical protein
MALINTVDNWSNSTHHNTTTTTSMNSKNEVDLVDDSDCSQIHPTETTELVATSLQEFDDVLNKLVHPDVDDTEDNNRSTNKKLKVTLPKTDGYQQAVELNPEWAVHDTVFRVRFLRTELYNVTSAVIRYLHYWNDRVSLYGVLQAFQRTIQKDMSSQENEALQMGYVQNVTRHSRLVYFNPANTPPNYDVDAVAKSILYTLNAKLRLSGTTGQQKGLVSIIDFKGTTI